MASSTAWKQGWNGRPHRSGSGSASWLTYSFIKPGAFFGEKNALEMLQIHISSLMPRPFRLKYNEDNSEFCFNPAPGCWVTFSSGTFSILITLQPKSVYFSLGRDTEPVSALCLCLRLTALYTPWKFTDWQSRTVTRYHQSNLHVHKRRFWGSENLSSLPQKEGGTGRLGTQFPNSQPTPPAKEILQKLFHPLENRHNTENGATNDLEILPAVHKRQQPNKFPCLSSRLPVYKEKCLSER